MEEKIPQLTLTPDLTQTPELTEKPAAELQTAPLNDQPDTRPEAGPELAQLSPEEQALIQAIFFDGVPVREYARRLSVQLRTVQYRRDRLLEKLRKKFF